MKTLALAVLICAAICLPSALAEATSMRVALVSTAGGETGKDIMALAETRLAEESSMVLLDRREVAKVLAEQKLASFRLPAGEQALAIGKMLRVDVFAMLELPSDKEAPLAIVVFDAQTGARLQDVTLPERDAEVTAERIADAVKAACVKRNRAPGQLKTVCLASRRNADLPRTMDSRCQAMATMLERALTGCEGLVVLERKRLEQVNKERALPTVSPDSDLSASLLTIDIELRRGAEAGKGLRAVAFVNDAAGKRVAEARAATGDDNIQALASTLQLELLKALNTASVLKTADLSLEARRFCREAQLLRGYNDAAGAVAAAESAYALDPDDRANGRQLCLTLQVAALHLLSKRGNDPASPPTPSTQRLSLATEAFGLALRAVELREESRRRLEAERGKSIPRYPSGADLDDPGLERLCHESAAPVAQWTVEALPAVQAFREAFHRQLMDKLTEWAADSGKDRKIFSRFAGQWHLQNHRLLPDAASDSRQYIDDLVTIFSSWLESWKRLGDFRLSIVDGSHFNGTLRFFLLVSPPRHYQIMPQDYAPLRPLFQTMQQHPVPLVQDYGYWGEIWLAERCGGSCPSFEEFKAIVRRHIEQSGTESADAVCESHYAAMLDALTYLKLDEAQRRQERFDLLRLMLDRKDMIRRVVHEAVASEPVDREESQQLMELMDRVELALNDTTRSLAGAPGRVAAEIRKELANRRQRIESSYPEFARTAIQVPWKQVRPLIRQTDFEGLRCLAAPFVYEDSLFVAGIHETMQGREIEAFRVPLDGGPALKLGKILGKLRRFDRRAIACAGGGYFFVSDGSDGIVAFPLDGGEPLGIDQTRGLPSGQVLAMAWHYGKLYAALADGGYFVRFDPRGGQCEVLAASRRKEKQSPLDDIPPFNMAYLAGDRQRHRLLMTLRFRPDDKERAKANGLWQYEPTSKAFKQLFEIESTALQTNGGTQVRNGAILLWCHENWLIRVDLKTDKPTIVHTQMAGDVIPGLHPHRTAYRNFAGSGPPYAEVDGRLWCVQGMFARLAENETIVERLPTLDTGKPGASYRYLERVGDGSQLIVGDDTAFWLVTL